jgi:molybdopterin-guanine dinucleotide biosynthesis protein A
MTGSGMRGEVAGVILAGGRARRLGGRIKALLEIDGERIIDRQLRVLRAVTPTQLVVVKNFEAWDLPGVRVEQDQVTGVGPIGGLQRALQVVKTGRALVLACDLPFVTVEFLRFLLRWDPDADAVVPRGRDGLQPLCAVYSTRLLPRVDASIASGTRALHELLDGMAITDVPSEVVAPFDPDGVLFLNVNTPAEHSKAIGRAARTPL